MSTTTEPVTTPLDVRAVKIGMTVRLDPGHYRVVARDATDGTWNDVRITYTDGVDHEFPDGTELDIVLHAAMPGGAYWREMYKSLQDRLQHLAGEMDARSAHARANAADPPDVRAAHAFEADHIAAAMREALDLVEAEQGGTDADGTSGTA